jgi:formyltetrahydrofolate synthetase
LTSLGGASTITSHRHGGDEKEVVEMVIVEMYGENRDTGEEISWVREAPGEGSLVVDYEYLSMASEVIRNGGEGARQVRRRVQDMLMDVDELEQELEDQHEKLEKQLTATEVAIAALQTLRVDCKRVLEGKY